MLCLHLESAVCVSSFGLAAMKIQVQKTLFLSFLVEKIPKRETKERAVGVYDHLRGLME